jgi:hypothetical protein
MSDMYLNYRIGVLMTLAAVSPSAATWLNEQPHDNLHGERGDITVQNVIWMAIAAAGAFVIAVILYNKFRTKANNLDVDNPGVLPAG